MPTDLQVVLGATGGVGQALVQALAVQGAQVRAVNRSGRASVPASVEVMAADLTNRESARAACQGAMIVYHCAGLPYDQWATYMRHVRQRHQRSQCHRSNTGVHR